MIESDRLVVSGDALPEERVIDRAIRPQTFADYTGQESICAQLEIFIQAAKKEGRRLIMFFFMDHQGLVRPL